MKYINKTLISKCQKAYKDYVRGIKSFKSSRVTKKVTDIAFGSLSDFFKEKKKDEKTSNKRN